MNRDKLAVAIAEAERFLARAKTLPEPTTTTDNQGCVWTNSYFPVEQGAIRRSSMDLTRSLADLRKRDG